MNVQLLEEQNGSPRHVSSCIAEFQFEITDYGILWYVVWNLESRDESRVLKSLF